MNIITLHLAKRLLALKHERKFSVAQDGVSIACVKGITLKTAPIRESQGKHHQSICAQNKKVEDPLPTEEKEKPETED